MDPAQGAGGEIGALIGALIVAEARAPPPPAESPAGKRAFALCSTLSQAWFNPWSAMLQGYLPVLVFLVLGGVVATAFTLLNGLLGPRKPQPVKNEPYECGLPSDVRGSFRFGISFYLIAMLFILFDIEVVFLYPVAVRLEEFGAFALGETIGFIALLFAAFVFVWRRGALEWR